jgi:hypothetical protein
MQPYRPPPPRAILEHSHHPRWGQELGPTQPVSPLLCTTMASARAGSESTPRVWPTPKREAALVAHSKALVGAQSPRNAVGRGRRDKRHAAAIGARPPGSPAASQTNREGHASITPSFLLRTGSSLQTRLNLQPANLCVLAIGRGWRKSSGVAIPLTVPTRVRPAVVRREWGGWGR